MRTKPIWITAAFFIIMLLVAFYITFFLPPNKAPVIATPAQTSTTTEAMPPVKEGDVPIATSTDPEAGSPGLSYKNVLRINNFTSGELISSPLHIEGEAKGWYFEATFPIKVLDSKGKVLGSGPGTAQGDWMATDSVPFAADISFVVPAGVTSGSIVFSKDNPSGNAAYADSFKVPVVFKK